MTSMEIRHTELKDLETVMAIYAQARQFMAEHGNPRQWGPRSWPPESLIRRDIEANKSYVCEENGEILAIFYYDQGVDIDPTYRVIDGPGWTSSSAYGVVHRIATSHTVKGAGAFCINWAFEQCGYLRMDTHGDNIVMQNLLKKLGFTFCGIIHIQEDNDPRLAYERTE